MASEAIEAAVTEKLAGLILCINQPRCADGGYCGCREFARELIAIVEGKPAREAD